MSSALTDTALARGHQESGHDGATPRTRNLDDQIPRQTVFGTLNVARENPPYDDHALEGELLEIQILGE